MTRLNRLTARAVQTLKASGRYADGGGLYLRVTADGRKSWAFRFMRAGRAREMGLGAVAGVSLADARQKAAEARRLLAEGKDPIEARAHRRARGALGITFRASAERYIEAHQDGWRNAKHAAQWRATLATHAFPSLGDMPVASVDLAAVVGVLEPLWRARTETASRVRGRIEAVLDWAAVRGLRAGDNPARWRGHLDKVLPARAKVQRVRHHPAMPYAEVPAFVAELREQAGIAALALLFVILTAARTGEVIGARWDEIDGAVWTIPGERMKSGRSHRVPLGPEAMAILDALRRPDQTFVFPGGRRSKPLSNMALTAALKRTGRGDVTVHGFRSSFRDWAAEQTAFPREVAEAALAHALGDKVEAAYRRSDLFERRRRLMEAWAGFLAAPHPAGAVVPLRAAVMAP